MRVTGAAELLTRTAREKRLAAAGADSTVTPGVVTSMRMGTSPGKVRLALPLEPPSLEMVTFWPGASSPTQVMLPRLGPA